MPLKLLAYRSWGWIDQEGTTLHVNLVDWMVLGRIVGSIVSTIKEVIDAHFEPGSINVQGGPSCSLIQLLASQLNSNVPIYVDRLHTIRASSVPFSSPVQPRQVDVRFGACLDKYAHQSIVLHVKSKDLAHNKLQFRRYLQSWSHLLLTLNVQSECRLDYDWLLETLFDFPLQNVAGLICNLNRFSSVEKWRGFTSLIRLTVPSEYLQCVYQLPVLEFLTLISEDYDDWEKSGFVNPVKLLPRLREYTLDPEEPDICWDIEVEHSCLVDLRRAHLARLENGDFDPITIRVTCVAPASHFRHGGGDSDYEPDPFFASDFATDPGTVWKNWKSYIRKTSSLSLFGHKDRFVTELLKAARRYFATCSVAFGVSFARANRTKPTLWRCCLPLMSGIYDYLSDVWDCGGPHHQARERRSTIIRSMIRKLCKV